MFTLVLYLDKSRDISLIMQRVWMRRKPGSFGTDFDDMLFKKTLLIGIGHVGLQ